MATTSKRRPRKWVFAFCAVTACSTAAATEAEDEEQDIANLDASALRPYLYTGNWTNWHNRKIGLFGRKVSAATEWVERTTAIGQQMVKARGLLKLSAMRDWMLQEGLFDTNPANKIEIVSGEAAVACDEAATTIRTIDGTCNDPASPAMGAAHVRFGRNVSSDLTFPTQDPLAGPSPRTISLKLLSRPVDAQGNTTVSENPSLNLLAASWLQFEIHDWISHGGVVNTGDVFSIPLEKDDPFRAAKLELFLVPKTELRATNVNGKPTFYNEVTHWWDGSQLYGSDRATALSLRAVINGLAVAELRLDGDRLPRGADGVEQTGFSRNWWLGLSLMHHAFAREHNQIVRHLRTTHSKASLSSKLPRLYPSLKDDDARYEQWLFDHARMINAAQMAKIHTIEWTPSILRNPTQRLAMRANWYGLASANSEGPIDTAVDALLKKAGVYDPGLNGIVGGRRNLGPNNVPFSITEEFTSLYRMHSLLPEKLRLNSSSRGTEIVNVADTRLEKAHGFTDRYTLSDLFASFGSMHSGTLTLHNFPRFLQNLSIPGFDKYDVGAVDILRDRERGVPRYNAFRQGVLLKRLSSIDEITPDETLRRELKDVYGWDAAAIDRVDLLIGALAEAADVRPEFFGFGETQFQIFHLMASRRLMADRFFTEAFNEETYTREGLEWIAHASLKSVLVRNYPDLEGALAGVDNAFLPWDGSFGRDNPTSFPP